MAMLTSWWSLLYLVPFGLALVYLGLFVMTGLTFGEADVDADADVDAHVEVDGDADVDGDAEADGDHDADGEQDGDGHWGSVFLGLLGAGKVPLSLGVMMLLLLWGLIGFGVSVALAERLGPVWLVPAISLPVALVGSVGGTWLLASLAGRVVTNGESAPARRQDLVGRSAEAVYEITETFGMAAVRSAAGDLLQVPCKARSGETIAKGSRVVLFAYDKGAGMFSAALMEAT